MDSRESAPMKVVVVDDTPLNLVLMGKLVGRLPGTQAHTF